MDIYIDTCIIRKNVANVREVHCSVCVHQKQWKKNSNGAE